MTPPSPGRNYWSLIVPILFAIAYRTWFIFRSALTGFHKVDGLLGVTLGLFICARAAANVLDMLLYGGSSDQKNTSTGSAAIWAAVNVLVELAGLMLVFFALTRFFR